VISALAYALVALTAALAVFGVATTVLGRPAGHGHSVAVAVVEVGLLGQALIAAARVFGGTRPPETQTFLIYLLVSLCVLPIGLQWARADEESRWGGAVVAVAAVATGVAVLRLLELWGAGA
jgi:hypothetical protein